MDSSTLAVSVSSPSIATDVAQVACGDAHTCFVTNSMGLRCFGDNSFQQLGVPAVPTYSASFVTPLADLVLRVATNRRGTCVIMQSTGGVRCWGTFTTSMIAGTLDAGSGAYVQTDPPSADVASIEEGVQVVMAEDTVCVLTIRGAALCFGGNQYSETGVPVFQSTDVALAFINTASGMMGSADTFTMLAMGDHFGAGVTSSGKLLTWGRERHGSLGIGYWDPEGDTVYASVNTVEMMDTLQVTSAGESTCFMRDLDDTPVCFGSNSNGQLAISNSLAPVMLPGNDAINFPMPSPSPQPFTIVRFPGTITMTEQTACRVDSTTGNLFCWGTNTNNGMSPPVGIFGEFDTSYTIDPLVATPRLMLGDVDRVATGYGHACVVVASTGGARCWGSNVYGQLGSGDTQDRILPSVTTVFASGVVDITCGNTFTCALKDDKTVECWGDNW